MTCIYTTETVSLKRKRSGESEKQHSDSSLPPPKVIRVVGASQSKPDNSMANPQHTLQQILSDRGVPTECYSYQHIEQAFQVLPKDLEAWNFEVLGAVRKGDVEQLRLLHQQGINLQCSNQFGETLLHLACRKTLISVVKFFIDEVGIPVNIHDDTGRTPLHDAFWTPEPNEELIDVMLMQCPEMLLVRDKRGHSPLQYSRQAHWDTWNAYLQARKETLKFNKLAFKQQ